MSTHIKKEGKLEKQSRFVKVWKKRWTVLQQHPEDNKHYIYTYEKESDCTKPTEAISIDQGTEIKPIIDTEAVKNLFCIENKKHQEIFHFKAQSKLDRTEWIKAINDARISAAINKPSDDYKSVEPKISKTNERIDSSPVKQLLDKHNLGQYYNKFIEQGYDQVADLDDLDMDALKNDIGMKPGHARRFLKSMNDQKPNKVPGSVDTDEKEEKSMAPVHKGPKKKVSLVFVGETGVGKTTLLQSLKDFIDHIPFENVNCTTKPEATGLSQTQNTQEFPLSNEEWAVNIIDTPGIGDTSGATKDAHHMGGIVDFLGDYGDFNAVCILIKRGTTRLTTRMRYIVNELRSNMPKDVQGNFIVIMTRSDVPVPDKDTMAVIQQLHLPTGNIIPVNNGAYEELDLSQYPQGSPIIEIVKKRQKTDYDSNHSYLQILLKTAYKMQPYQGGKMKELKMKRDKLKEQVGVLKCTIDSSFDTEKQIKEQLAEFKNAKSIADQCKAWDSSGWHTDYEYVKTNGKITTHCNACSKSCHIGCGLSYDDDLTTCWASGSGGRCTQCGCSMNNHCHLGWERKSKQVWVTNINKNMQLKHLNAKQRKAKIEKRKQELKDKLKALGQKRDRCAKDIRTKYNELEKIAIIGYNESFEQYMIECKKAVEKDEMLTKKQKEHKINIFQAALQEFHLLKDAISDNIKKAASYVF